jgi:hypothetical protein
MPRRFTMSALVQRCKQRCDLEHDSHISDAEWKALLSEQYGELWSIVAETGYRYFESTHTITATGADGYAEPADHYATVQVTRVDDSGREHILDELMHQEEPRFKGLTGAATFWTLVDDRLYLYPKPESGTYRWYYLQQPTGLADYADDDVIDVVTPDGEAFLIWGVAVKARSKSESDTQLAMVERERYRNQLQFWAAQRAIGDHRRRVTRDGPDLDAGDWRYR